MFRPFATALPVILLAVSLASCGSDSAKESSSGLVGVVREPSIGPNGYKFDGKNGEGEACTTGLQNFETKELLCLNIQDPVQNHDCATDERIHKFVQVCSPAGYDYYESHRCNITLLQKDAVVSGFGRFDPKDVLTSVSYCTGRSRRGFPLAGIQTSGRLYQNVMAKVSMAFVPRKEERANQTSYFQLKLYNDATGAPLIEPVAYHDGLQISQGPTRDGKFKYVVACGNEWACDADR